MSTYGNDWIITFSNSENINVFFYNTKQSTPSIGVIAPHGRGNSCEQECEAGYDFVKTEKYMTKGFKATCHS